jgi:hypothetical protein
LLLSAPLRRARRAAPIALSICALVALAAPAGADAAPQRLPDQGMYDTCNPVASADHCVSRLRYLSGAGFKVVQLMKNLEPTDLPALVVYANAAHALGMKVIWHLSPGIPQDTLITLVTALRLHPATWGYYVYDEPSAADRDKVATFAARVKALDPNHQRLVMGCGNCYGGEGSVSFLDGIDVTLGSDVYPVWEQAPDQPIVSRRVTAVASGLQKVADRTGRRSVIALQAWRWGDSQYDSAATGIGQASRFPTRQEIEDQRNAAITAAHPDLILWFTLNQVIGWEPGQRPSWWQEPTDPKQRWANLVGGAFAPVPQDANERPVARFTLKARPMRGRGARAASNPARRVKLNAGRSYDPDGRIARYRWYVSGRRGAVCARRRCSLDLRRAAGRKVKLVVTDDHGARSSGVRRISARSR